MCRRPVGGLFRLSWAIVALIALVAVAMGTLSMSELAIAQTPTVPGAPSITSVTAGDRQLSVNWSAASTPADRPVVDYQVVYREGSSGAWSMASSYGISHDSAEQSGSDTTWAHNRDPLDLGTVTGGVASYIERTNGGSHNLAGVYRVKADVAAVRIRVDGDASGAATIRANYTTAPITDLRHNGTEMGRVIQTATQTGFQLTGVTPPLSANSYIWVDGWDHTSTNTQFPEFAATTIESRRLRLDIATVSTSTNITIDGLTNQRSYQMRVRARNSAGWGSWSNVSSGTPLGTPDAPAGLWLESGNQQVIARWSAPSNNGGNAISDYNTQYRIESSGADWTDWQASTVSTATIATITGLINGTKYEVRVRAVNSAGNGLWTARVIDTAGKPSPPTFTLSTVRRPLPPGKFDKGGLLSMTLAANANGSAVTDYDLRSRESGTSTWYTYRDRSLDSGKLTTSEASGTADPIDFGTFSSPSGGVAVTRESIGTGQNAQQGVYKFSKAVNQLWVRTSGTITGGGTVVARWHTSKPTAANLATAGSQILSAATDSDNTFWQDGWVVDLPANSYVWLHTNATETLTKRRLQLDFTGNSASSAMVLTGLQNGKTYELQARAKNTRGWGAWGSVSGIPGTPMRPVLNTPTVKSQALDVSWTQPASDNGLAVGGYDVRYRAGSTGAWTSWPHAKTAVTATITGLTNNTEYEVQVRARNGRGSGFWSAGVKGTPVPQVPDTPAAPTLTSSGTTMTVSWEAPPANGADITDYDVVHCSSNCANESSWTALPDTTDSTALTATIASLINGTTYQVRVRAQNSVGNGPWSIASTHIIGRPSAPAAPALVTGNTQITATWTAANANGSAITDYDVRHCSLNCDIDTNWTALPDTTDSAALTATITGLTNGTIYSVQVRAQNAAGPGPWSPTSSMKVGLPAAPSAPRVVVRNGFLVVYWSKPSGNGTDFNDHDVRYCSDQCESGNDDLWTNLSILDSRENLDLVFQGLTNGTTYYVQVRARNTHGNGAWSPWVTGTPGTPTKPSAPTLTGGDHKIIVNWSSPGDNGSTITDYDVRHCSAKCGAESNWIALSDITDSTARSAVISNLEVGTTYQVQVRAENSFGAGQWSASSTLTLAASPVPASGLRYCDPTGLTQLWVDYSCYIKAGESGIKSFDAVTVRGSGDDYIDKREYPAAGVVELLAYNPQGGFAVVETSLNGVTQDVFLIDVIRFGIRDHYLDIGDNEATLTVWLHSPSHGSPGIYAKNGVDYARSRAQLTLPSSLSGATHDGDNPYGNWVQSPTQVVGQHADSITFNLLVLVPGTYNITIDAYRPGPDATCPTEGPLRCYTPPAPQTQISYVTQASANATFHSATVSPPATPSSVSVTRGDGTLTATWPSVSGPTSYHVTYTSDNGASWSLAALNHASTSITIDNADNSATYIVGVRARNPAGDSGWRNSPAAGPYVPPVPPAMPSSVSLTRGDGTLTATWPSVSGATSYHVTYTSDNGVSWQLAALNLPASAGTTSITIDDADNSATYIVGVRARNPAGDSGWRNSPAAGSYVPPVPPTTPSSVSVSRGDGTVTATWPSVSGATSYHVTYTSDNGASWSLAALNHASNSITIDDADNSATYIVGVRARNVAGDSGWRNSSAAGPYVPD